MRPFFNIKNDISSDSGCDSTDLRATFPAMPSHLMEGLSFFRNAKPVDLTVPNLVDLPAKGMADLLLKEAVNPACRPDGLPVLFYIFEPFATDQRTNRHDGSGERATCLTLPCHAPGQRTSRLKNLFASYIQFFLQSCKNGLSSPKVLHIVL